MLAGYIHMQSIVQQQQSYNKGSRSSCVKQSKKLENETGSCCQTSRQQQFERDRVAAVAFQKSRRPENGCK